MIRLLIALLAVGIVFIPVVTNGDPPPVPERLDVVASGYRLVGGADLFVACAADGTLRVSAYALRPDGTEGHTVFAVDVAQRSLIEHPAYRPPVVIRGSLAGQPLTHCGIASILSAVILEPNAGRVRLQQGG